jgi:hypothetical protein
MIIKFAALFSKNKVLCQLENKDNQLFLHQKATKFEKRDLINIRGNE